MVSPMWSWTLAARAATVCVGTQSECVDSLQYALDDASFDTVEIYGPQVGPFTVDHDVTLVGLDPAAALRLTVSSPPGPLLDATGSLTLRDLTLDANHWDQNLRATGEVVVLERVGISGGYARFGAHGCVAIQATTVSIDDTVVNGCWHYGTESGLWATGVAVTVNRTTFRDNDGPALKLVGAERATLDRLVVKENGVDFRGKVGGVHLIDVDALAVSRSWFCDNVGHRGGGLRIEGGCITGDCRVEHDVFQANRARVGGGLAWGSEGGVVSHSTFVGNRATNAGLAVAVAAGHLDLDSSLFVDGAPDPGSPTLDTWLDGTLTLTGSAVHAVRPGLPLGENLDLADAPAFLDGYVAPACGPSVTLDPTVPANAPLVAWPDDAGIGALTTADCGPWCDDLDADTVPAMWDCAPVDPNRGIGLSELGDDGIDQDCDGRDVCYADPDGDGHGSDGVPLELGADCPGDVRFGDDCDEADPTVHPGAPEQAGDGTDADCDGLELCFADADQDGVTGDDLIPADLQCTEGSVGPVDQGDCDDTDPERRGAYCAVRVVGGCDHAHPTGGWIPLLGLWFVRRRR